MDTAQRREEEIMSFKTAKKRRKYRTRRRLKTQNTDRPRLSVHRTNQHIYAQVIDDRKSHTIVQAASTDPELRDKGLAKKEMATEVGKLVAKRAKKAGVQQVMYDRGEFRYTGRVAALADGAREGGLDF
jgi:large subunit ribosomal protein L18